MRRRFSIAVSAMVLAAQIASPAGAQEPQIQQLEEISALLDENDVEGLRSYLSIRPELLEGDTELARLLTLYMEETDDPVGFLGFGSRRSDDDDDDLSAALRSAIAESALDERETSEPDVVSPPPASAPVPVESIY